MANRGGKRDGAGRPNTYDEPRARIELSVPKSLKADVKATGEPMTGYIIKAIREKLAREARHE